MRKAEHLVRKGESLWRIAGFEYADTSVWPSIAKANGLKPPYTILVGMKLKLPHIAVPHHHSRPIHPHGRPGAVEPRQAPVTALTLQTDSRTAGAAHGMGLAGSMDLYGKSPSREFSFPAYKFKLDDCIPAIYFPSQNAEITLRFTGDLTLKQEGAVTTFEFSKKGLASIKAGGSNASATFDADGGTTAEIQSSYRSKLSEMTSGAKLTWNPDTKEVSVSCQFSLASKVNGKVFATSKYEWLPPNGLKYTYEPAPVKGKSGKIEFEGLVGYVVEVRPRENPPDPSKVLEFVVAGGLVIAGVALLVGDGLKDAAFPPAAVESPMSWAAAMALFRQAAVLAAP